MHRHSPRHPLSLPRLALPAALLVAATTHGALALAQAPLRLYVDAGVATGANDGSSWPNAFQGPLGLQNALTAVPAAASAEIWVANGTYRPGLAAGGTGAHFALRDGVALYGGFAGGETELSQRDPVANPAVLSGDLASNDVPTSIFGIPGWNHAAENSLHVVRATNVGASARLDGFTIRRGSALGSFAADSGRGAGLLCTNASPSLASCTFRDCSGSAGGGAYVAAGAPAFESCTFVGCQVQSLGAGAWIDAGATPSFDHCTWRANVGSRGVGLFVGPFTSPSSLGATRADLVDCLFESNTGPIGAPSGIGVHVSASRLSATRTRFVENHSGGGGGGVFVHGSEADFVACDFVRNSGDFDGGGALYVDGTSTAFCRARCIDTRFVGNNGVAVVFGAQLELTNCTLWANDVLFEFVAWPVVMSGASGAAHLRNCIVRHHAGGLTAQFQTFTGSSIAIDASCIEGWNGALPGSGNTALDPLFADGDGADNAAGTLDDDLNLLASSPCIDRSDHAWRTLASSADVLGAPRYVDRLDVVDIGSGCAPRADLGALERGPDGPFTDLGGGLAGSACTPHFALAGALTPGAATLARASGAQPFAPGVLVLGLQAIDLPLLGAILVPEPLFVHAWVANAAGSAGFAFAWPADIASGATMYGQSWHLDAGAPQGWAASNAQLGAVP